MEASTPANLRKCDRFRSLFFRSRVEFFIQSQNRVAKLAVCKNLQAPRKKGWEPLCYSIKKAKCITEFYCNDAKKKNNMEVYVQELLERLELWSSSDINYESLLQIMYFITSIVTSLLIFKKKQTRSFRGFENQRCHVIDVGQTNHI